MNAPFRAEVAVQSPRASEIVPLLDYLRDPDRDWDALAERPSDANSFAERWFIEASAAALDAARHVRMLVVREEGQLIGLMPIVVARRYGRMPVRHVENWLHYNSFFGAPLVRRAFEPYFWHHALALLDHDADAPNFLHLVMLDENSNLTRALLASRRGTAVVHHMRRALLASDLGPTAYYEATVRKKKRKEIGRLKSRLAELGAVTCRRLDDAGELDAWTDCFLDLEASGWKGREGAALANDRATATLLRASLARAQSLGKLDMLRLDLDGRAIAMLVNFLCPPGSYSFKIAFDEDFARFSPGVLIQLENLSVLERPEIEWMDSCAVEDHPMINSLWGERRDIVRVTVPLRGTRRRATFAACRAAETASARFRSLR